MTRRLLIAFVVAILPVIALLTHPELRRVLWEDLQILIWRRADFLTAGKAPEREAILQVEGQHRASPPEERASAYAQVARRFGKPYLYAAALREAHRTRLAPTVQRPREDITLQRRQAIAREAVKLAEEMIAVDPDNAFPYLSKVCALLVTGQKAEAFATLQRSAQCTRYDGYEPQWAQVVASPTLTAETRILIISSVFFPHLTNFRETFRYWRQEANRLEQKGDHAGALQMAEYLTHLGALMLRADKVAVTPMVSASLLAIAWDHRQLREGAPLRDSEYLALAQDFARYAQQHGRSDLSTQTLREANDALAFRRLLWDIYNRRLSKAGDDPIEYFNRNLRTLLARRAVGIVLLWWGGSLVLFWIVGRTLLWWNRTPSAPDRVGICTLALINASLPIATWIAGLLYLYPTSRLPDYITERFSLGDTVFSLDLGEPLQAMQMSTVYPLALLTLASFLVPTVRLARAYSQGWLVWSVLAGITPGISALVIDLTNISAWLAGSNILAAVIVLGMLVFGLVSVVGMPVYAFIFRRRAPLVLRVGMAMLWGLGLLLLLPVYWMWSVLWLASGILLWTVWAKTLSQEAQLEASRWLFRFAGAALTLALLCVWLYVVNGYANLALRRALHHMLSRLFAEGEVALWREML